ncbi:MAG TPA: muconolactone Delta-isomerase family protein [Candidatus Methylacidiphilales bacterium]
MVHAHHEPQSFCSSMARTAAETLTGLGHQVVLSDLHAMGFQPVSDRRNFTTTAVPDYLKQQREEAYATDHDGFAPDVEAEIRKLEACDLLVFSFPIWWFGLPAILKGWVDRVLVYKRIYSRGRWYENGVGHGKRALVMMTTGGSATKYSPGGLHGPMERVLAPINEGIFWFNGFSPLPPFVAWEAAHGTDDDRHATLEKLRQRLHTVFTEPVIELPRFADTDPETAIDTIPRFMVTLRRMRTPDAEYAKLVPAELEYVQALHRQGKLLSLQVADGSIDPADWRCFLLIRERSADLVHHLYEALPLAPYFSFELTPLDTRHAI